MHNETKVKTVKANKESFHEAAPAPAGLDASRGSPEQRGLRDSVLMSRPRIRDIRVEYYAQFSNEDPAKSGLEPKRVAFLSAPYNFLVQRFQTLDSKDLSMNDLSMKNVHN